VTVELRMTAWPEAHVQTHEIDVRCWPRQDLIAANLRDMEAD
jgi:hypothetical protein